MFNKNIKCVNTTHYFIKQTNENESFITRRLSFLAEKYQNNNIVKVLDFTNNSNGRSLILKHYYSDVENLIHHTDKYFNRWHYFQNRPRIFLNKFIKCVSSGINFIHENKYVHCDIKLANIFFDVSTSNFVIGDFGIANHIYKCGNGESNFDYTQLNNCYHLPYKTFIEKNPYGYEIDWHSLFVCVFYCILINDHRNSFDNPRDHLDWLVEKILEYKYENVAINKSFYLEGGLQKMYITLRYLANKYYIRRNSTNIMFIDGYNYKLCEDFQKLLLV